MSEHKLQTLERTDLEPITVGRYVLHRQIARGGMATIHIARLMGDEGFSRIVAAKRLHSEFAEDSEFVAMFLDEARIASKVHHRNVVPVLDVVTAGTEVILVQEYVHGVPLSWLLKTMRDHKTQMPLNIAVSIACQVLAGLHATHETVDELGAPLNIVHRDVSPQNVMVAIDGSSRLLDFGVAKATMAAHVTREGTYKGKLAYSAPEQLRGQATRQSDVYSLSVLLWELLVGQRMHRTAKSGPELVATVLNGTLPTISDALSADRAWDSLSPVDRRQLALLDPIVQRGLAVDTRERWPTAADMEEAISNVVRPAASRVVAAWLRSVGQDFLDGRDRMIAAEEASWRRVNPMLAQQRASMPSTATPLSSYVNLRPVKTASDESLLEQLAPSLRSRKGLQMFAFAAALVLAFLCGLAWVGRDHEEPPAMVKEVAPPVGAVEATAEPPPRVTAHVLAKKPQHAEPAPAPAAVQAPAPPALTPAALEAKPHEERLVEKRVERMEEADRSHVQRRVRAPTARAEPAAEVAPAATLAAPATQAKPANDCSPPYYFEGAKKVFKPACL